MLQTWKQNPVSTPSQIHQSWIGSSLTYTPSSHQVSWSPAHGQGWKHNLYAKGNEKLHE